MSHSARRATARIDWRRLCQTPGQRLGAWHKHRYNANCVRLRAAFEKESIQQQQDHGTDDRHDPTGHLIPPGKDPSDPSAYKGAGDTKQNRYDATARIFPGH